MGTTGLDSEHQIVGFEKLQKYLSCCSFGWAGPMLDQASDLVAELGESAEAGFLRGDSSFL